VVVLGGVTSWPLRHETVEQRVRFMAQLGVMSCALFALVVIATWLPPFILNNCEA
jgi:hypothetical protein